MDFKLSTTTIDGIGGLLVSMEGELDISTADRLAEQVSLAVDTDCPLVVDLTGCHFIDSTGLRCLLHAHRSLAGNEQPMGVVVHDGQVRKLLATTAIDLSVPVFDEVDDAVAFLAASKADGAAVPGRSLSAPSAGGPSPSSPGP
jgi:anti-sigma B factor antagonist